MNKYNKPKILKKKLLTNFLFKKSNSFLSLDFLAQCPGPPVCDQCSRSCFLAGTKVTMANSDVKNIEDVVIGDTVLSYNRSKNILISSTVKATIHEIENIYISIDHAVKVTPHHRFWVLNIGWTEAQNLKKGMKIQTSSGNSHIVNSLEVIKQKVEVFNLSLFGKQKNYFANAFLVHNTKCCDVAC